MARHVIIDGNNLLHAAYEHAPIPFVARETLVRIIERWARGNDDRVTLVFDGAAPRGGLSAQMTSKRVDVRFSAPATADDVIIALIHSAPDPARLRVVTGDTAVRREARHRRCSHTESADFTAELFPRPPSADTPRPPAPRREKPPAPSQGETDEWLRLFGLDAEKDEPFDGSDAMTD